MIRDEIFTRLAKRTGYEDTRSLQFLHHLMRSIQPACVLEFGTAFGASAAYMAAGIGSGLVISIDNYSGDYAKSPDEIIEPLRQLGLNERVRLLKGNTHNAAAILQRSRVRHNFEVLFMDADHSYKGLQKEYQGAIPLLAKEHIVIVDDTHGSGKCSRPPRGMFPIKSPEIMNFVTELALEYPFCIMMRDMHWGMSVFCTNSGQVIKVADVLEEVSNG